jgi:hypothetical protein
MLSTRSGCLHPVAVAHSREHAARASEPQRPNLPQVDRFRTNVMWKTGLTAGGTTTWCQGNRRRPANPRSRRWCRARSRSPSTKPATRALRSSGNPRRRRNPLLKNAPRVPRGVDSPVARRRLANALGFQQLTSAGAGGWHTPWMPLFEMTPDKLVAVPTTTFAAEQVLERADLQRLLRANIDVIADSHIPALTSTP